MNTFCLIAHFAVIAAVFAATNQASSKPGDLVHWTVGANSKGAAQLNHTGATSFKTGTVTTAPAETTTVGPTVSAVAKVGDEVKPTDGTKTPEAANATGTGAAAAAPAGDQAAKAAETEATSTVAPAVNAAAGQDSKVPQPAHKLMH